MATAKDAVVEPNLTECAVCHETFTVPKILPCGHLLCRDCLVTWLQSQPQAACPLCRCVIVEKGQCMEGVADGLPTDLAMTAMVEAETLLCKQHMCSVCDNMTAVALCLQCGDMFCHQCRNVHKKLKATKQHEVENLTTLTTERLAGHHPATCPDHNEKVSEVHCPTHGTSVCLLCATTTHRDCPKLVSLQSQVGELTAELEHLSNKLNERATKADAWLCRLDKQMAKLQREAQAALDEVKNVCDRLKAAVEARFLQVGNMILKVVSDTTTKVTDIKYSIIQKRSKIAAHSNLAKRYKRFTEHKYFKDMVSVVKGRLPDLDTVDSLPKNLQLNQKLTLTIDLQAVTDAERIISGLGDCKMTSAVATNPASQSSPAVEQRPSVTPSQSVLCGNDGQQAIVCMTQFNPMKATLSRGVVIDTRTPEDSETPDIVAMATGPSCEVLYMSDCNNKSIKLFSLKSNSLISTLELEVRPWAIALVRDNLLAVTLEADNVIKLIDITEVGNTLVHTVNTARQYRGICVFLTDNDGVTFIVSCGHDETGPATVDMITMEGNWMRTIVTSHNLPELQMPWYLHADTRRDVLYIPDFDADCVFCVQLSTGRVLHQLQHPQLSWPFQVCTDSEGNLYMACNWSKCVLVKSLGNAWRVLVKPSRSLWDLFMTQNEQEARPKAVCVTDTSLVVSFGKHNGVKVYKMA